MSNRNSVACYSRAVFNRVYMCAYASSIAGFHWLFKCLYCLLYHTEFSCLYAFPASSWLSPFYISLTLYTTLFYIASTDTCSNHGPYWFPDLYRYFKWNTHVWRLKAKVFNIWSELPYSEWLYSVLFIWKLCILIFINTWIIIHCVNVKQYNPVRP